MPCWQRVGLAVGVRVQFPGSAARARLLAARRPKERGGRTKAAWRSKARWTRASPRGPAPQTRATSDDTERPTSGASARRPYERRSGRTHGARHSRGATDQPGGQRHNGAAQEGKERVLQMQFLCARDCGGATTIWRDRWRRTATHNNMARAAATRRGRCNDMVRQVATWRDQL